MQLCFIVWTQMFGQKWKTSCKCSCKNKIKHTHTRMSTCTRTRACMLCMNKTELSLIQNKWVASLLKYDTRQKKDYSSNQTHCIFFICGKYSQLFNFHDQAFTVTVCKKNSWSSVVFFLFLTLVCYYNFQNQKITMPQNIGYITELTAWHWYHGHSHAGWYLCNWCKFVHVWFFGAIAGLFNQLSSFF